MGKKSDTTKPAAAIAETPSPKKKTAKPVAAAPVAPPAPAAVAPNGAAKAAPKKKPIAKVVAPKKAAPVKAATPKPVSFSSEDIALRAYYIAEHRQRHGIHGDSHSDWVEAERQLRAEQSKATGKKPAKKKA